MGNLVFMITHQHREICGSGNMSGKLYACYILQGDNKGG